MDKADIGLIGLAVMGENLVLNMESKGFTVAVYNRTVSKVKDFVGGRGAAGVIVGSGHSIVEYPPLWLPEPVVDTNGAGDSLAVGLLSALCLDRLDLDAAIARGQYTARRVCTQRAGEKRLTSRADLEEFERGDPSLA